MTKTVQTLTRSVKFYLALLILSTGLILYGTLFPADYDVPKSFMGYDKLVHFIMFSVWTVIFGLVRFLKNKFSLWPIFITSTLFGLVIEILQYLLPTNRSAEYLDLAADFSGTLAAIALLYFLSKNRSDFFNTAGD